MDRSETVTLNLLRGTGTLTPPLVPETVAHWFP